MNLCESGGVRIQSITAPGGDVPSRPTRNGGSQVALGNVDATTEPMNQYVGSQIFITCNV